jgi:hypothetical protein
LFHGIGSGTYVSARNGSFQFSGLNPDFDYEVVAIRRGKTSRKEFLDRFESRPEAWATWKST